jgi:threonine dehydratase
MKCESQQRTGSFKIRGAFNRLLHLSGDEMRRGVIADSSGNHAQAVALSARELGLHATIVMPEGASPAKVAATRGYGAAIVFYDRYVSDGPVLASALAEEQSLTLVKSFDDPYVISGQGTAALELLEQVEGLDAIVVSTGGGGLLSGSALAAFGVAPAIEVHGVEPETADDFYRSLRSGHIVTIPAPDTVADALRTQSPGSLTFEIARRHVKSILTVSEIQLCHAVRFAFERLKCVVEPGGAAALAAVLCAEPHFAGKRIGIILSGGNVDAATFSALLERSSLATTGGFA